MRCLRSAIAIPSQLYARFWALWVNIHQCYSTWGPLTLFVWLNLIFICCTRANGQCEMMLGRASEISVCTCTIEFLFVRDTFGVEWLGKSSRIAAVLDLAKHQHNTAKPGIASQHGHFHPFCPLYQWVKPARLFAPYKSCDHYGPKEVCQTLFRPWGQPWLQPLGSRLFEPGLGSKNRFSSQK